MHGGGFIAQALIYLIAAVLSVPLAKRLGLGSVLGYLLAGVIVGPFLLGFIGQEQHEIMSFAELGVIMMLFLIGLELKPSLLWQLRKSILGLGGMQVLLSSLLIGGLGILFGLNTREALAVGLILSLSSTAIVLQSFQEKGLMKTPAGQSGFSVLLFQDIAVIPIIALLPLLALQSPAAADQGHGLAGWQQAVAIIVFVTSAFILNKTLLRYVFRFVAETRLREIFTALALLIVLGISYLMGKIGLSPALGTFVAGVVLADNEYRHELESVIDPFKAILLGLFFISVGASINFGLVVNNPALVLGLVLLLVAAKALVFVILAGVFRLAWSQNLLFSLSLAQGGEFAFVLFGFALQQSVLPADIINMLVVVVAISMLITPVLMIINEKILQPLFQAEAVDMQPDRVHGEESEVIIAGFGRFGQIVGRLLNANQIRTTVLDHSPTHIEMVRRFGFKVFYGDASRLDLLEAAGIAHIKLFVIAVDDAESASEIAAAVRERYPHVKILARAIDRSHLYELMNLGVEGAVRDTFHSSLEMGEKALQMLGYRAYQAKRSALIFHQHDRRVIEELHPLWKDRKNYIVKTRQSGEDLEKILQTEHQEGSVDEEKAWDTSSLIKEYGREESA